MAFVLNDRVKETTTTTGTGTINLGGAATGFETFVAGIGNSNVTYYCIAGQGTAEFEVGIGTVTDASPDTLSRTTILSSSNSDSAVDFSAGTKDVFCTLPAGRTIREVDTALNVPTGTTAQRASSPAAGDFRYNTTTGRFEGYLGSAWGSFGSSNSFFTNIFAGDGSDTTFTLSQTIDNENDLLVFIDGVFQAQNVYSVSGTTLTFATAPANGRVITVYSVKAGVSGSNYTLSTMTGDGSDTTLTLNTDPVNENNVQVYIDGTYQNKDTFSVSGTTLTFSEAPPNNTKVEAIVATQTTINTATQLLDADGDTKVMVEESSDEDKIRFDTGGTERMVIDENGDVSINVGKLTTSGANGADNQGINITDTGYSKTHKIYGDNSLHIQADSSQSILFKPNGTEAARFTSDGRLGIGNTSPSFALSITSSSGTAAEFLGESGPHGLRIYGNDGGFGSIGHVSSGSYDIKIDSAGIVTQPSQPAFGARVNSSISGFNPSSLTTVVVFNLEFETDRNSDYDTSTGLFTAPVDGLYWFQASIYSNHNFQQGWLVVNSARHNFADVVYGSAYGIFAATYYAELDANDTVGFHPYNGSQTSVLIYDNNHHTYFRGGLLY